MLSSDAGTLPNLRPLALPGTATLRIKLPKIGAAIVP